MSLKSFAPIAAIASVLAFTGPAFALDLGVGVNVGVGATAGGSGDAGGAEADTGLTLNVGAGGEASGTAAATANATGETAADLFANMDADSRVQTVIGLIADSHWQANSQIAFDGTTTADTFDVGAWLTANTDAQFATAMSENASAIAALQAAIAANTELSSWLAANNIDVSTVVALGVAADGELAVFTY